MLLTHGADLEAKDNKGRTSLIRATKEGSLAMVRLLQKNGANVEATDNNGRTPLYFAVKKHEHMILDFLLRVAGATPNVTSLELDTPLMMAVKNKCYQCVRRLLRFNADIEAADSEGGRILHHAVASGSTPILQTLLKRGVNCDSHLLEGGGTPLQFAVSQEDEVSAKLLLDAFAAPDAVDSKGRSALHCAVMVENEALVRLLIDHGASQVAQGNLGPTPPHLAVMSDNIKILQLLLKCQPAVDAPDEDGNTALHWAVKSSRPLAYVELLLSSGASVECSNKGGKTPCDLGLEVGLDLMTMLSAEHQSELQTLLRKDGKLEYMTAPNEDSDTDCLGLIGFENSTRTPVGGDNPSVDESTGLESVEDVKAWIAKPASPGLDPSIDYFNSYGVESWSVIPSTKVVPLRPVDAISAKKVRFLGVRGCIWGIILRTSTTKSPMLVDLLSVRFK